jgi:hypothetical protein
VLLEMVLALEAAHLFLSVLLTDYFNVYCNVLCDTGNPMNLVGSLPGCLDTA